MKNNEMKISQKCNIFFTIVCFCFVSHENLKIIFEIEFEIIFQYRNYFKFQNKFTQFSYNLNNFCFVFYFSIIFLAFNFLCKKLTQIHTMTKKKKFYVFQCLIQRTLIKFSFIYQNKKKNTFLSFSFKNLNPVVISSNLSSVFYFILLFNNYLVHTTTTFSRAFALHSK